MACASGIYTRLGLTGPTNGTWFYVGYAATSAGPFTSTPAIPLINVANNTALSGWGYDFPLDASGKTPGFYKLRYDYTGGSDDVVIELQNSGVCAGQNFGITIEEGQAFSYTLFSLISGGSCPSPQTGGTWINQDSSPGFNTGTSVLNTASITEGQYVFEYKVNTFDGLDCNDCSTSAFVTLVVAPAATLEASIASVNQACVYTYELENGDTAAVNSIHVTSATDGQEYKGSFVVSVVNCDSEVVFTETLDLPIAEVYTYINTNTMYLGGYFESVKMRTSTGSDITIPLGPYTATYSGLGGTTNATALTYNPASAHIFYNAVTIAIKNYLGVLGFTSGTHYRIHSIGPGTSFANSVQVSMGCKHSPTGTWIGLRLVDAVLLWYEQPFASRITTGAQFAINPITITRSFSNFPCFSGINALTMSFSLEGYLYAGLVNFNNLPVSTANNAVTLSGNLNRSCTDKRLTVAATGCGGTLSYLWGSGQTVDNIVVPNILGVTHTVDVDCTSPLESITKTITL